MKLYEIARQAIVTDNQQLAESLLLYVQQKHGLNHPGFCEYLTAHDVDPREFEETMKG